MSTIQDRLTEVMRDNNLSTQADLARFSGASRASVGHWFAGISKPSSKPLTSIATKGGYSAKWIIDGVGPKYAEHSNVAHGPAFRGKVPLISWVQAGAFSEAIDLFHPGDADEWIKTTVNTGPHTFALRVEGDSMMDTFPPGVIIIVEPDFLPEHGHFVIAKNSNNEATFKQLIRDGGDMYLKPLNNQYPTRPLGDYQIIGVVREATQRFA
jgi:SOS-response transcriptional repressor LexA